VNAKKIFEIVRELPEGGVSLDLDGTVLLLESEKGFSCKIAGADINDFPGVPETGSGAEFDIHSSTFHELVRKSSFAVSRDESRAALCGILWEVASDKTGMEATDGHRLGSSFINTPFPVTESISKIISQKSVSTLVRITDSKNDDVVRVTIGEKYISFNTNSFSMVSRLVEGQYPDYTKVIPKNNPKIIEADRLGLLEAIRRVSVLSSNKNHLVRLIFKPGVMDAIVMNRDIGGEARESVTIDYDGDEHTVGFNGMYFNDILDIVKTQKVRLEMNTQISACLVFPVYADEKDKKSDDLFLIMPLRIMDEV
jgi:DNA polymerase-3 subunit beta